MIFFKVDENGIVYYQFANHEKYMLITSKTEEELLQEGFLVESIPEPIKQEDKIDILKWDGTQFYYEYEVKAKSEIELLKEQVETSNQAITELSMIIGGMF